MSVFMTLLLYGEQEAVFKEALRRASVPVLKDVLSTLEKEGGSERKRGRLRAAIRRARTREK